MTEKLRITIVGLGLIGASAGLALRRFQDKVTVTGHDRSRRASVQARKLGAVDAIDANLIRAVAKADRVLLALPPNEIRETLTAIAGNLTPGCILVDTSAVKVPVMQWAREILSADVHLVGGHPIVLADLAGDQEPRADLFEKRLFCLTPDPHTGDVAVRLAADLVEALGARPFFLDAKEHDGLVAGVEHLPEVIAGALMATLANCASWRDMRKVAAGQWHRSTTIAIGDAKAAASEIVANREHLLPRLDQLIAELGAWRSRLADQDEAGLAEALLMGLQQRDAWSLAVAKGSWDEDLPDVEMPTAGTVWRSLLGFRLPKPPSEQPKTR